MKLKEIPTTTDPGGGNASAKSLNDALLVSLAQGNFLEITVPAIPQATPFTSQTIELPVPRTRMGVIAYYWQSIVATSGSILALEWSSDGSVWYPCPTSTTGESRLAVITAAGGAGSDDRILLARGQPMHRYFRAKVTAGTAAGLPGGKLFFNWGPVT